VFSKIFPVLSIDSSMPLYKVKKVEQANKATNSFEISSVDLGVLHYIV
jgi:hypothetical protein